MYIIAEAIPTREWIESLHQSYVPCPVAVTHLFATHVFFPMFLVGRFPRSISQTSPNSYNAPPLHRFQGDGTNHV
jgi:hypothetical protein